ncbi:hypothetical protein ACMZOO_11150 [Catenovulum sp. SX2]|uniref:hypothetical protein n=1 Tax=Catenovulum sp. SX2 TaxID=3398614 RepID=UPI003F873364
MYPRTNKLKLACSAFVCLALQVTPQVNANSVLTVKPVSADDSRYAYPELILNAVLATTADEYGQQQLAHADFVMSRNRMFNELLKGDAIHVALESPKAEWDEQLLPIYIPVRKGIQGYRIFLIDKHKQSLLNQINSLDALKQLKTGAGRQWSTTQVLRDNGFNVVTGTKFEGLFWMLMGERFVTFGRGVNEAASEVIQKRSLFPYIQIEKNFALYIPMPTFFYVSPKHPKLAQRIAVGLDKLIDSGEFDKLFYQFHLDMITDADLAKRTVYSLHNKNLPAKVPLQQHEYWYKPGDELAVLNSANIAGN